jgi:lipopolysaccharide export system permease protein
MRRYSWYILRQLVGPLVFILLGLTAVVWLTQSLRFVDLIVNKGLSIDAFLYLTLLLLPSFFTVIAPIALFASVLFIYNKMINDSELISLKASGISHTQLAAPPLAIAGVMTLVIYSMTLYFSPASFRDFKDRQFNIRSDFSGILLQEGVFTTVADDLTVYVRARRSDGELLGILVHDNRIYGEPVTMMAERGTLVDTESGPRFVMINGNRQQIEAERRQLSLLYFDRYTLDLGQLTAGPKARWREARERYLHELFNPGQGEDDQNNKGKFWAEGHQRLVAPLFSIALVCLALGAILSGEFSRRGQWRLILAAILSAFLFEAIGLGLVSLVAKSPALMPLMYLNVATAIGLGWYVMIRPTNRRSRWWWRTDGRRTRAAS